MLDKIWPPPVEVPSPIITVEELSWILLEPDKTKSALEISAPLKRTDSSCTPVPVLEIVLVPDPVKLIAPTLLDKVSVSVTVTLLVVTSSALTSATMVPFVLLLFLSV